MYLLKTRALQRHLPLERAMLTTVVVMEARLAVHVDLPVDLLVQVIAHVGIVAAAVRVRRVVVDVVVERVVEEHTDRKYVEKCKSRDLAGNTLLS